MLHELACLAPASIKTKAGKEPILVLSPILLGPHISRLLLAMKGMR